MHKGVVFMTRLSMNIDEAIKTQAEELFSDIGLTMTTAINLFLRAAIREQKIPFELSRQSQTIATADELQAIKEFEASFEKNPVLIDADESYKKARQIIERARHV